MPRAACACSRFSRAWRSSPTIRGTLTLLPSIPCVHPALGPPLLLGGLHRIRPGLTGAVLRQLALLWQTEALHRTTRITRSERRQLHLLLALARHEPTHPHPKPQVLRQRRQRAHQHHPDHPCPRRPCRRMSRFHPHFALGARIPALQHHNQEI